MKGNLQVDFAVRERILDAAVRLFAERGYDGVNLRDLTATASVNLAAVSYYFGGKKGLFREVLNRRIRPLGQERLSRLSEVAEIHDRQPDIEQVIEVLVRPLIEAHGNPSKGGAHLVQLFIRTATEPLPGFLGREFADEQQLTLTRFAQAIRRHALQIPPDEFLWRFTFVVGAMHHALANLHQMPALTRGICRNDDYDSLVACFVKFSAAVFSALA